MTRRIKTGIDIISELKGTPTTSEYLKESPTGNILGDSNKGEGIDDLPKISGNIDEVVGSTDKISTDSIVQNSSELSTEEPAEEILVDGNTTDLANTGSEDITTEDIVADLPEEFVEPQSKLTIEEEAVNDPELQAMLNIRNFPETSEKVMSLVDESFSIEETKPMDGYDISEMNPYTGLPKRSAIIRKMKRDAEASGEKYVSDEVALGMADAFEAEFGSEEDVINLHAEISNMFKEYQKSVDEPISETQRKEALKAENNRRQGILKENKPLQDQEDAKPSSLGDFYDSLETGTKDYLSNVVGNTVDAYTLPGTDINVLTSGAHAIKLGTEKLTIGGAETFDSVANYIKGALDYGMWKAGSDGVEINGRWYPVLGDYPMGPSDLKQMTKDAFIATYQKTGIEPELEDVENFLDIGITIAANFATMSTATKGIIDVAQTAVTEGTKLSSRFLDNVLEGYAKGEVQVGSLGVSGGMIRDSLTGDQAETPEQREKEANETAFFATMGALSPIVKKAVTLTAGLPKAWTTLKNKIDGGLEEDLVKSFSENMPRKLRKLIAGSDRKQVEKRLALVKLVRAKYPDFQPSIAVVLDTQAAYALTKQVDSHYFEESATRFNNNIKIIDTIISNMRNVDPDFTSKELYGLLAMKSRQEAQLTDIMVSRAQALKDPSKTTTFLDVDTNPELMGDAQEGLKKIKGMMQDRISLLEDSVDPDSLVQVPQKTLLNLLERRRVILQEEHTFSSDDPVNTAFDVIKKKIEGITETGPANFLELRSIIKKLNSSADTIGNMQGLGHAGYSELSSLGKDIIDHFGKRAAGLGDEALTKRYNDFRSYFYETYSPLFRAENQVGTEFTATTRRSNLVYKKNYDELGPTLFPSGSKVAKLEQYLNTIKGQPNEQQLTEGLNQYAMNVLEEKLVKSKNPAEALETYMVNYRHAIDRIPGLHDNLIDAQEEIFRKASKTNQSIIDSVEKQESIASKWIGLVDPSQLIGKLLRSSDEEVARVIDNIQQGKALEKKYVGADEVPNEPMLTEIGKRHVTKSLSVLTTHRILMNNWDSVNNSVSYKKLQSYLDQNEGKIKLLVGTEEYNGLRAVSSFEKLADESLRPKDPSSLSVVNDFMSEWSIAPASMASRYLQVQMGKVGHTFLAVDAIARASKTLMERSGAGAYNKILYDWDNFNRVLKHIPDSKVRTVSQEARDYFAALTRKEERKGMVWRKLQNTLGSLGFRGMAINETLEEARKNPVEREVLSTQSREAFINATDSRTRTIAEMYPEQEEFRLERKAAERRKELESKKPTEENSNTETRDVSSLSPTDIQYLPNTNDEQLIADSAAEYLGFQREQKRLRAGKIDRKGSFNPKTGEMTWLS